MNTNKTEERFLVKQTIKDIAQKTSKKFKGINTPQIKMIIEEEFKTIEDMLLEDDYIIIKGLGVLFTDYLDEIDIKDPRNSDIIHFEKRRVPKFYFSRSFKKKLKMFDKK